MAKIKIFQIYNNLRSFSTSREESQVNEFLSKVNLISLDIHVSQLDNNSDIERVRYTIVYDENNK